MEAVVSFRVIQSLTSNFVSADICELSQTCTVVLACITGGAWVYVHGVCVQWCVRVLGNVRLGAWCVHVGVLRVCRADVFAHGVCV